MKQSVHSARQAYVKANTRDCPMYAPDENQAQFFQFVDGTRDNEDLDGAAIIAMNGFPASWANLAWIQAKAEKAQKDLLDKHGAAYVSKVVELIVVACVQRVKFIKAKLNSRRKTRWIEVNFRTKDDGGYYSYGFSVTLPDSQKG